MNARIGRRVAAAVVLLALGSLAGGCRATVAKTEPAPASKARGIVFLDRGGAARAIADDSLYPYFALLNPNEMVAKTGRKLEGDVKRQREEFRRIYSESTLDFTESEREMLTARLERLRPVLSRHYPFTETIPWSFLKVTEQVENTLPHTRGAHIVLSEAFLEFLGGMGPNALPMLDQALVHEKIHVVQRLDPRRFLPLYEDVWGFRRVQAGGDDLWLRQHLVINPDGTDRWLYPLTDGAEPRWVWPTVILDPSTLGNRPAVLVRDLRVVAFEVESGETGLRLKQGADGLRMFTDVNRLDGFAERFPYASRPYHPNEISADAFARVVLDDIAGGTEPDEAVERMRRWFRENLGPDAADDR